MAIVTKTLGLLTEIEQSKMGSVLVSAVFKNNNPDSSIKGIYWVLCKGNESENKRMDVAVFEDKTKPIEISKRWQALRNSLFLYTIQDITPNIWDFAVKQMNYSKDIPVIPCPMILLPGGTFMKLVMKLDATHELTPACKENLLKLHKLLVPAEPGQSLLEPEDQIATKLHGAFG